VDHPERAGDLLEIEAVRRAVEADPRARFGEAAPLHPARAAARARSALAARCARAAAAAAAAAPGIRRWTARGEDDHRDHDRERRRSAHAARVLKPAHTRAAFWL